MLESRHKFWKTQTAGYWARRSSYDSGFAYHKNITICRILQVTLTNIDRNEEDIGGKRGEIDVEGKILRFK